MTIEEHPMMSNIIKFRMPDSPVHEDSANYTLKTLFCSWRDSLQLVYILLLVYCTNQFSRHSCQPLNLVLINYVATIAQIPRQDVRMTLSALLTLINGGRKLLQR